MVVTKEALAFALRHLNGFLPVAKPAGVCCNNLLHCLKADLYFTLNQYEIVHGVQDINYARDLDPFAAGLITFIFGNGNLRRRNFAFADYKYRAKIEFGVEKRQLDCTDGPIQGSQQTKVDHLNEACLQSALSSFVGKILQDRRNPINNENRLRSDEPGSSDAVAAIYNQVEIPSDKPPKLAQKYPFVPASRDVNVKSLELLEYTEPLATVDITCQGSFNVRQFAYCLGQKLNTQASLVGLTRIAEGPITLDDSRVLQIYDLNFDYYMYRMSALQEDYRGYLVNYDDYFEKEPRYPRSP